MVTYTQEERNNFITSLITAEKTRISNFLANNPEILAMNLAEEMVYVGLPIVYVAAITGVPIDELNKSQIKH